MPTLRLLFISSVFTYRALFMWLNPAAYFFNKLLVPLLQIAPSKTDTERLLVVSPELADVIAAIITAQLMTNASNEPNPMAMSSIELIRTIVNTHASAATTRNASAISAGAAISCGASPV